MQTARICLWFANRDAAEAARFYAETFPNSHVGDALEAPADNPSSQQGDELVVNFTVLGISCMGLNGGPAGWSHSEAFSFVVETADQAETDRYWNALTNNGGAESMCGWCKDRWGISWQITPRALYDGMTDPDPAAVKRVMQAMMTMRKIDVAAIVAARRSV